MQAADLFEQRVPASEIAARLRLSAKSVFAWQALWRRAGRAALVSKGPSGAGCRLSDAQPARLQAELDAGPAAHGWSEDQRWTLPRITLLIGRLFHVRYTERGVCYLLHRLGWSPQVPVQRAAQRDEAAIAAWRQETWSRVRRWPASSAGGSVAKTRPGSRPRPPTARTWSRRGRTPVVAVSGKGSGRVSMAGLIAVRPGLRTRLFYRLHLYHGRRNETKGLREADYIGLLTAVHAQLRAPVILVWDNVNHHVSAVMRRFVDAHDWLTVVQLPAYAPELNPTEGVWSHIKRGIGNLAACTTDQLAATMRSRLKGIQYRPTLLDGFLAQTGLVIQPQPP